MRWKLGMGEREPSPVAAAPDRPAGWRRWVREEMPTAGWRATWLGHASFLIEGNGRRFLIDPIFSRHCAPLPLPGLRRMVDPPCPLAELGEIDAVLLTHSHYDHLDLPTLRKLGPDVPLWIAEGHAAWLRGRGFREVRELPWFGRAEVFLGIELVATPAQHFTARTPWDRNRGHWCGWRLDGGGASVWHAGDTGWCEGFAEMAERLGGVDLGLIPIGAYSPRWLMRPVHLSPEEAVAVFLESGCRRAVGMHWGTFRLTDEPLREPPLRLEQACRKAGLEADRFVTGDVGESWKGGA